jgi:hypothetical protein
MSESEQRVMGSSTVSERKSTNKRRKIVTIQQVIAATQTAK